MGQGLSLHIGLNSVDASKYNGWAGTLAGCVNDANAMQAIAVAQGFTPTQLITEAATADAILTAIGQAARTLKSGDTFLISYSGHGGRVPDPTGDSPDGMDDTWVAYDRMVLGHELYNLWSQFASGVRVEVYSDSCHSGTVIRDLIVTNNLPFLSAPTSMPLRGVARHANDPAAQAFNIVYGAAITEGRATRNAPENFAPLLGRAIPSELALHVYNSNLEAYQARQWATARAEPTASVILISGCQDNQVSQDGQKNGLFTEKLLNVWNSGSFAGNLPQFHKAIVALMPATQTPNYFTVGPDDPVFTAARPLTIVSTAGTATGTTTSNSTGTSGGAGDTSQQQGTQQVAPTIAGPSSVQRGGQPPTFQITTGSNRYYAVELAADPALFGNSSARQSSNFYASWNDSNAQARMTDPTYTLSADAWAALSSNDKLYYRALTTSSGDAQAWDNYMVSVTDGDAAAAAPSFSVLASDTSTAPAEPSTQDEAVAV
ncbi:caspase family protein (plasmid) [Ralstonia sp. 25C]|uniref:caspase family protein n=1 Tax=unclassified Ralstonia TaxID=209769 RepID=UPI003CE96033